MFKQHYGYQQKEEDQKHTSAFEEVKREPLPPPKEPTPHFAPYDFTEPSFGAMMPFMSPLALP